MWLVPGPQDVGLLQPHFRELLPEAAQNVLTCTLHYGYRKFLCSYTKNLPQVQSLIKEDTQTLLIYLTSTFPTKNVPPSVPCDTLGTADWLASLAKTMGPKAHVNVHKISFRAVYCVQSSWLSVTKTMELDLG